MRLFTIACTLCVLALPQRGSTTAIPDGVKDCVSFVYTKSANGDVSPVGTAFLLAVPDHSDSMHTWCYLVTARHVLLEALQRTTAPRVFVRLNTKSGDAANVRLPLHFDGPERNVFVPDDATIDLAVVPLAPSSDLFAYRVVPSSLVPRRAQFASLGITEGTDVFFVGLFHHHTGEARNSPIVRFGHVAMLPADKVDWDGQPMNLYLLETASFGGNSGSPVFFYLGSDRTPGSVVVGPPEFYLAGVMMGAFLEGSPLEKNESVDSLYSVGNVGISAVVPGDALLDLLACPELRRWRGEP